MNITKKNRKVLSIKQAAAKFVYKPSKKIAIC